MINRKEWSKEEIDFILKNFQNMSWKEIGEKLNRTPNSIQMKVKRLGLKKYPYYCDKDFFNVIDTQEKAYWLGFIFADGYVQIGKNNSAELGIELSKVDIDHLRKFNKSINGNYNISERDRVSPFDNSKTLHMCKIRIYSIQMVNDLCNLGVVPHKTKNIKLPNISDDLIFHFIRGYFDGDGSIYLHSKKNKDLSIKFTSGSKCFINELREVLYNKGINSFVLEQDGYSDLIIGGLLNVDKLLFNMYKNSTVCLIRKFNKAIHLYEKFNIHKRLPLRSEMGGFYEIGKEIWKAETLIRVEG